MLIKGKRLLFFVVTISLVIFMFASVNVLAKTKLVFYHWNDDTAVRIAKTIEEEFEKEYPDIDIERVHAASGVELGQKLKTMIAAGNPPDVFRIDDDNIPKFVENDQLLAFEDYMPEDYNPDMIYDKLWEMTAQEDKKYAVVAGVSTYATHYNKELLKEAGVPFPSSHPTRGWDRDTLLEYAQKLTKDINGDGNIDQYGWTDFHWSRSLRHWVYSSGNSYLNKDKTKFILEESTDIVQWAADLISKYEVTPTASYKDQLGEAGMLVQGKAAMVGSGNWLTSELNEKHPEFTSWDIGALPKDKLPVTNIAISTYAALNSTEHPEACGKFLAFLAREETQNLWLNPETAERAPAIKTLGYSEEYAHIMNPPSDLRFYTESVPYAVAHPLHPTTWRWRNEWWPVLETVMTGERKAEDALAEVTPKINKILADYHSQK